MFSAILISMINLRRNVNELLHISPHHSIHLHYKLTFFQTVSNGCPLSELTRQKNGLSRQKHSSPLKNILT